MGQRKRAPGNAARIGSEIQKAAEAVQKPAQTGDVVQKFVEAKTLAEQYPHYHKDVHHLKSIDVYRVLLLWDVTDPCLQHAIKKLLAAGQRGAKDVRKDVREAMVSCQRFLEMRVEDDTL